jgi:hypothetical protein
VTYMCNISLILYHYKKTQGIFIKLSIIHKPFKKYIQEKIPEHLQQFYLQVGLWTHLKIFDAL